MLVRCPSCGGEGKALGEYKEKVCEPCGGQGILEEVTCDICGGQGCPRCRGEGSLKHIECPHCDAQGKVFITKRCPMCRGLKTVIDPKIFN